MTSSTIKSFVLAAAVAAPVAGAQAAAPAQQGATDLRKDATILSSIAVGAVAGGPIGAMVGAASGVWIAGKVEQADRVEMLEADLRAGREQRDALSAQLADAQQQLAEESERHARMALEHLELEMLFRTGDSTLSAAGRQRLALLADYLLQNEDMGIRIEGFADPRGDTAYNLALSQARADAVAAALRAQQVPGSRIEVAARGEQPLADSAQTEALTLDDYALQRVARIALYRIRPEAGALSAAQR